MNNMFRVVNHPSFSFADVTLRSAKDVEAFERQLMDEQEGWLVHTFRAASDTLPAIQLHYKDPIKVLKQLYSAAANADGFKVRPKSRMPGEEIKYTTLETGDWWFYMQKHVQVTSPQGVVAPLLIYSDQTSLSNDRRTQGYPVILSLGNIACARRRSKEGHSLLAILPVLGPNDPAAATTIDKLKLFHKCLEQVLSPLKQASYVGLEILDPFYRFQWVFPLLCAYICDHPEGSKVTCTYGSNRSQFPCSNCTCGRDTLSIVQFEYGVRTVQKMKEMLDMIVAAPTAVASSELSKAFSLHPVESALWGFNGSHSVEGNPYEAVLPDALHALDIGLFKTQVSILRDIAGRRAALIRKPLEELDRRLMVVRTWHRFHGFRIPGSDKGGYFVSNANYAAFEHRAIMQVIVPCLLGVFADSIGKCFVKFLHWYNLVCRSSEHTEASLEEMNLLMIGTIATLKANMAGWQKSNFDIVKAHAMSHFSRSIRRSGLPWEYSTIMYEHMHIYNMKIAYRGTNKRYFVIKVWRTQKVPL